MKIRRFELPEVDGEKIPSTSDAATIAGIKAVTKVLVGEIDIGYVIYPYNDNLLSSWHENVDVFFGPGFEEVVCRVFGVTSWWKKDILSSLSHYSYSYATPFIGGDSGELKKVIAGEGGLLTLSIKERQRLIEEKINQEA